MARRESRGSKQSPTAKMLRVLHAVARRANEPMVAVADELGLAPPTVHRICTELERLGYLQRAPGTRRFVVARQLVAMAADVLRASFSLAAPQAVLRRLSEEIGEMCSLAILDGIEVVYIASAEPAQRETLTFRAGRRAPVHCTSSGRLFLAHMDEAELGRLLKVIPLRRHTRFTVTDPVALGAEIQRIRRRGYAITSQEYVLHILGAAVPVVDGNGRMIAALSVAAPTVRMSLNGVRRVVPRLRQASATLERLLEPPRR